MHENTQVTHEAPVILNGLHWISGTSTLSQPCLTAKGWILSSTSKLCHCRQIFPAFPQKLSVSAENETQGLHGLKVMQ